MDVSATSRWLDEVSERLNGIRKPRPVRTPPGETSSGIPDGQSPMEPSGPDGEEYLRVTEPAFRDLVELAQSLVCVATQLYTWTATAGARMSGPESKQVQHAASRDGE
jgi:hypothetical protein